MSHYDYRYMTSDIYGRYTASRNDHSHSYYVSTTPGSHTHSISLDLSKYFWPETKEKNKVVKVNQVDEEVLEAIKAPRRKAEVKRRVELAEKIGSEDEYEFGAVLKWTRKLGKSEYTYAAIKVEDGRWFVTGTQMVSSTGWTWEALLEWMVTGESTIENLEFAASWERVA